MDLVNNHDKVYDKVLEVEVGDRFEILLKENPTTGYRWLVMDEVLAKHNLQDVIVLSE